MTEAGSCEPDWRRRGSRDLSDCIGDLSRMALQTLRPVDRFGQPFFTYRFEEVIDSAGVKRLDCVLIEGSNNHDHRKRCFQVADHLEAAHHGHLEIEQDQVRTEFANHLQSRFCRCPPLRLRIPPESVPIPRAGLSAQSAHRPRSRFSSPVDPLGYSYATNKENPRRNSRADGCTGGMRAGLCREWNRDWVRFTSWDSLTTVAGVRRERDRGQSAGLRLFRDPDTAPVSVRPPNCLAQYGTYSARRKKGDKCIWSDTLASWRSERQESF